VIDAILEAWSLKDLPRAGWARAGVAQPESVAAHSWGVGVLVLLLLPPHLDRGRALAYAALHDLPEVRTGDITPADGVPATEKRRREAAAMIELCRAFPPDLLATWLAYEAQGDAESRFVRELDRLDLAFQAVAYAEAEQTDVRTFVASAQAFIRDPVLVPLLEQLQARLDRRG
jgi:putative hydrolase of HD superfamily